jgi:hypothetical protein
MPKLIKNTYTQNHGIMAVVLSAVVMVGVYVVNVGHAAAVVGDINADNAVNVSDLSLLLARWNTTDAAADINKDAVVNIFDLSLLLSHWGQTGSTPTPTVAPTPTPTAGSVKAIDSANTITDPTWFTKAYAEGIRLYAMHSVNWNDCNAWSQTQPQLKMALDAGLKIAVYTRNPSCWQGGINAAGPYISQLQFFAIDVETDPGVPATRAMVDGVKAMGVRPVLYSGSGMWPGVMGGNVTSFSDVPLWDTNAQTINYATWVANVLTPTPEQYGGWNTSSTMRIGIQQMFEYNLNGIAVDLNSFNSAFLK